MTSLICGGISRWRSRCESLDAYSYLIQLTFVSLISSLSMTLKNSRKREKKKYTLLSYLLLSIASGNALVMSMTKLAASLKAETVPSSLISLPVVLRIGS